MTPWFGLCRPKSSPSAPSLKTCTQEQGLIPFPGGVGSATNGNADTQQMLHRLLFHRDSSLCVPNPSILTSLLQGILHGTPHPTSLTMLSCWNCSPVCSQFLTADTNPLYFPAQYLSNQVAKHALKQRGIKQIYTEKCNEI